MLKGYIIIVEQQAKTQTAFLAMPKIRNADITLHERVTLTWLIYRNRFAAASVSWLSDKSYFDRKTIREHLKTLAARNYAIKTARGGSQSTTSDIFTRMIVLAKGGLRAFAIVA